MLYKFQGAAHPADSTQKIVLETDDAGVPTKAVEIGQVGELSEAEHDYWSRTMRFEKANKGDKDNSYGLGFEDLAPKDSGEKVPQSDSGAGVSEPGAPHDPPAAESLASPSNDGNKK